MTKTGAVRRPFSVSALLTRNFAVTMSTALALDFHEC